MDTAKLILTETVHPPLPLENVNKYSGIPENEKIQKAKDFESVFIHKLLEEMKNTIGDWGFEKDGASMQTQGIFWLQLAREIADNGGFGIWKDVYQFMTDFEQKNSNTETVVKDV